MAQRGETEREQDQGRRHRRQGRPSAETQTLLGRYQQAMRDALTRVLDRIEGRPPAKPDGTLGLAVPLDAKAEAAAWELAIKLGRELATEIDPGGEGAPVAGGPGRRVARRRGSIDFGPDA